MSNKFKVKKKLVSIALALALGAQPLASLPMNVFAGTGKNGVMKAPIVAYSFDIDKIIELEAGAKFDVTKQVTNIQPQGATVSYNVESQTVFDSGEGATEVLDVSGTVQNPGIAKVKVTVGGVSKETYVIADINGILRYFGDNEGKSPSLDDIELSKAFIINIKPWLTMQEGCFSAIYEIQDAKANFEIVKDVAVRALQALKAAISKFDEAGIVVEKAIAVTSIFDDALGLDYNKYLKKDQDTIDSVCKTIQDLKIVIGSFNTVFEEFKTAITNAGFEESIAKEVFELEQDFDTKIEEAIELATNEEKPFGFVRAKIGNVRKTLSEISYSLNRAANEIEYAGKCELLERAGVITLAISEVAKGITVCIIQKDPDLLSQEIKTYAGNLGIYAGYSSEDGFVLKPAMANLLYEVLAVINNKNIDAYDSSQIVALKAALKVLFSIRSASPQYVNQEVKLKIAYMCYRLLEGVWIENIEDDAGDKVTCEANLNECKKRANVLKEVINCGAYTDTVD